ncbi:MAG: hypothetical protein NVS1B10_03300 [Candidatus Saccharimonadales bacterium]
MSTASAVNLSGGVNSGGLSRSVKLTLDTANWVMINKADGTISSEPILSTVRGGLGVNLTPSLANANQVIQVNSAGTAFALQSAPIPPQGKVFQFYNFS